MMAQQIAEITKVPTNAQVIKILNEVIKRYNSLGSIYTFKGSVQTYDDLLAIENPEIGDVYNVIQEDEEHQIAAGSNFVWDGTAWDNLGGSLAGLVQSVNGINPDSLGNVLLPLIKNMTTNQGVLTITKNDDTTTQVDNIKKLYTVALGQTVDLNNLVEAGVYTCGNNSYAANYKNCPVRKSFLLEVQISNDSNMIWQFLTQYNDGSVKAGSQYTRAYQVSNGWSAWKMTGGGSNLATYTSLEQLGITPGEETFKSIHNALPINSELIYYVTPNNFNNSIYPTNSFGNVRCTKNSDASSTDFIFSYQNNKKLDIYTRYFNQNFPTYVIGWVLLAKQSDLTNLSNSVVKSVNGINPTNGNVTIDIPEPVIASEAEAKAGTNNTKFMTPLRTKQTLDTLADGFPVGWVSYQLILFPKHVKLNGAIVLRSDYPNLVTFATTNGLWTETPATEPWKFGVGDGSTTMVLPDFRNRASWGGDTPAILEAGLPNITGSVESSDTWIGATGAPDSALYTVTTQDEWADGQAWQTRTAGTYFDASRSNPIYGNSNTVQPPAMVLIPQIKYI